MAVVAGHFRRGQSDGAVPPWALSDAIRKRRYFYERFRGADPLMLRTASSIAALPTAAAAQVVQMWTPGGNNIEFYQSTAQTLHPVNHATKGLVLDGDQVDNETAEFVPGGNSTGSGLAFVTGTDDSFAMRATIEITDASGSDQLLIGFRKVQAYAVPTSFLTTGDGLYTDFCGIGFAATKANPNPVNVAQDLNDAGTTVVSPVGFTWADTLIHKLEIRVVGRRAMFLINGVSLGGSVSKDALGAAITAQSTKTPTAFTFDSGDTLVPFIFVRQDADLCDAVYLRELEIGFMQDMGA